MESTRITTIGPWAVAINSTLLQYDVDEMTRFQDEGFERLVRQAAYWGRFMDVCAIVRQWPEFLSCACELAMEIRDSVFVGRGVETAHKLLIAILGNAGFRRKEAPTEQQVLEAILRDIEDGNSPGLQKTLNSSFQWPETSQGAEDAQDWDLLRDLDRRRLLEDIANQVVQSAEVFPLGSLTQAISRRRNCLITLWPNESLRKKTGNKKAILFPRWNGEQHEYFILYAGSTRSPSQVDEQTRYCVAHELAHILLNHRLQNGISSQNDEVEAHYLATLFMWLRGRPLQRAKTRFDQVPSVLMSVDLPLEARWSILASFLSFLSRQLSETDEPSAPLQSDDEETAKQSLKRFLRDEPFRNAVLDKVESSFTVAL